MISNLNDKEIQNVSGGGTPGPDKTVGCTVVGAVVVWATGGAAVLIIGGALIVGVVWDFAEDTDGGNSPQQQMSYSY